LQHGTNLCSLALTEGICGRAKHIIVNRAGHTNIRCHCLREKVNAEAAQIVISDALCSAQMEILAFHHANRFIESTADRKQRLGNAKLARIAAATAERRRKTAARKRRADRIQEIRVRFDYEERWMRAALAQQARRRGISSGMIGNTKTYVEGMSREMLCNTIRANDLEVDAMPRLQEEARSRGISTGGRTQRQLLASLRKYDDAQEDLQPDILDIKYGSDNDTQADAATDEEMGDESEDETVVSKSKNRRTVSFAQR